MSSKTLKTPQIKRDLAERSNLGRFESWGSKVISARNRFRLEFPRIASVEPNGEPANFKYELKYDEREITTGNVYLYILSPSKSTASILPICIGDPIGTAKRLTHYFQRPTHKPALVTNNLKEEI